MGRVMMNGVGHCSTSIEKGEMKYQQGLLWMRQGRFGEAINAFSKASFFLPEKPQPFIAAAECYVAICDFQGAVKQYRRSLWLLRSCDKEDNVGVSSSDAGTMHRDAVLHENALHTFPPGDSYVDAGGNTLGGEHSTSPSTTMPPEVDVAAGAFDNGGGCVTAGMVQTRLAGILDALSIVLFNVKDYVQALRFAEDSLELFQHPRTELHRCAYLVALEREDEAEKTLEKHIKENPSFFIESSSLLVHLYCLRQSFQNANSLLEKVPNEERQNPQVLLAQHIFDRAFAEFRQRSVANADLQGITRCLLVFPKDASLLFERAKCYINSGLDKKAVPDLFRCIKVSDGGHKAAIELMTKTLFRLGECLDGQNGMKDAIEYYTSSLVWHGDNIPVLLARGDCYTKLEDYQHALQDFLRVANISPQNPDSTRRIAFLHDIWGSKFYEEGNLTEAEKEFSSAIATCDTEPLFYYHRARCRFDLNEPRFALRDVLSCHHLNPKDPIIREFVAAHIGNLVQGMETQRQGGVKLPEVSQRASYVTPHTRCDENAARGRMRMKQQYAQERMQTELGTPEALNTLDTALTCKSLELVRQAGKSYTGKRHSRKARSKHEHKVTR